MMSKHGLLLLAIAVCLRGQTGQEGPRPEWPCLAGRAVDPAYLETSESTGGQVFLFQKSEIGKAGLFLSAQSTHPATVLRALGMLSGPGEYEIPIDSTMRSLLVMASVQCRKAIGLYRPSGAEMTAADSAQVVDLQAGRGIQVDNPEPGAWKVRLEGTGVFVLAVRAQTPVRFARVDFVDDAGAPVTPRLGVPQRVAARISGEIGSVAFEVLGPSGERLSSAETPDGSEGRYQFVITPATERFRIRMTGVDASGIAVQRDYPVLFRAHPPN